MHHGYSTGDLIGIYSVLGNTAANCDPANPWQITYVDGYNFTLNSSIGNGAYTSTTLTINSVTNGVSPITVGTTN